MCIGNFSILNVHMSLLDVIQTQSLVRSRAMSPENTVSIDLDIPRWRRHATIYGSPIVPHFKHRIRNRSRSRSVRHRYTYRITRVIRRDFEPHKPSIRDRIIEGPQGYDSTIYAGTRLVKIPDMGDATMKFRDFVIEKADIVTRANVLPIIHNKTRYIL
jgi:hypothetical protein